MDQIALRASAERPALLTEEGTVTFGELLERAAAAAVWLEHRPGFHRQGVPRVGLACGNGVTYIVLAMAILKAGGCLVPLADELTETERQEIIQRTGLSGMILGRAAAVDGEKSTGAAWVALQTPELANERAFSALDPAFIRFSSGTTGKSKGVVLSHAKLRERIVAANAALEIGAGDRILWLLPMAHHFAVSIMLYLYHGACTVIATSHLAEHLLERARTTRASVIYGAPCHYSQLAADRSDERWPDLRLAVTTAAPLPAQVAQDFHTRFGKPLVQGLGMIEIGLPLLNTGGARDFPTAVGRPLPAFDVELRDDDGRPMAAACIGELWIKGPGMFDAYLSPWQTVDEICVDGWFATGDLAETDASGRFYLRGRKMSVLNVNGMKIFPEEVETVIESHPAVRRCRVSGVPHAILGTVPVADVILHEGERLTPRELIRSCRESLSAYKVPVRVNFVDALPLTESGKLRRT
ncbi:AMP-binding protein [bacterium]|nr:AMP-binding protein [bacterium]